MISRSLGGAASGCHLEQYEGMEGDRLIAETQRTMITWGMLAKARGVQKAWKLWQRGVICGSVQNFVPRSICPKCRSSIEGGNSSPQPHERL